MPSVFSSFLYQDDARSATSTCVPFATPRFVAAFNGDLWRKFSYSGKGICLCSECGIYASVRAMVRHDDLARRSHTSLASTRGNRTNRTGKICYRLLIHSTDRYLCCLVQISFGYTRWFSRCVCFELRNILMHFLQTWHSFLWKSEIFVATTPYEDIDKTASLTSLTASRVSVCTCHFHL